MSLTTGQAVAGTQFADVMKTLYLDPLNDQIHRETVLLNRLQRHSNDVSGNFAYLALLTARNPGKGSRKDVDGAGPKLPAIGQQSYKSATFKMVWHYGRGGVSGPVMDSSDDRQGAFASALDTEMTGLTETMPEDLNRQICGIGHGRAATLASTQTTSTVIEVSSRAVMSAKIGDRVHFADITAGDGITPASGTTVTAIDRDQDKDGNVSDTKHKITLAAASGTSLTVADDAMYFGGGEVLDSEDVSRGQEMYGLFAAIDDSNPGTDEGIGGTTVPAEAGEFVTGSLFFGGIDRTNTFWRATKLVNPAAAGTLRPVTVPLWEEAYLTCTTRGAKPGNIEMYSGPGLWATFGLEHIGGRVFNDFKEKVEEGFIAIMFNNQPYFSDRDLLRHQVLFLDMSTLLLMESGPFEFMDKDGSIMERVKDRDAYEFTLRKSMQLGSRRPNTSVNLADLQASFEVEVNE